MWCQIRYWQQTWKLEDEILTKHHYPDTRTRFTQHSESISGKPWVPVLSSPHHHQVVTLSPPAQFSQYCFTMWHKIFARWICWLVSARLWSVSRYRQWAGQGPGPGQGWAPAMRTLTRNARHSDRRLSYSDSLLSHAQNLTFVLGHYFPKKYLVFTILIVFSKVTPLIVCHSLWYFFCESEGINKLCWTFGQQIYHLNVFVCLSLNKSR